MFSKAITAAGFRRHKYVSTAEDERDGLRLQNGNLCHSAADPDPNPDPPDPDPPDPHVFGPPGSGSGSFSKRYGSGSFYH